jgi:hypothetical protein
VGPSKSSRQMPRPPEADSEDEDEGAGGEEDKQRTKQILPLLS